MSLVAGILGATTLASAGIGAYGASKAAGAQSQASKSAAQLEYESQQNALDFEKQQWQTTQANEAPFLQAGQGAVTDLADLLKNGGFPAWTGQFQAPTAEQAAATPGYQFALKQGQQAIERSAAAKGGLLSGGTAKALDLYSQGVADTNYQQVYNNAFQQYLQGYNQFQQNQANQYNRLAGLAGTGQVSAGTLANTGAQTSGQVANTFLTGAQQQGQSLQNAAAATASGYAGIANAAQGGLGGLGNTLTLYSLLNKFGGGGGAQSAYDLGIGGPG